jgi:hypothetical protein
LNCGVVEIFHKVHIVFALAFMPGLMLQSFLSFEQQVVLAVRAPIPFLGFFQ